MSGPIIQQRVHESHEQCRWAEAAPHWRLEQSAAERYWCGHQLVEKATENMRACRWTRFWTYTASACGQQKLWTNKIQVSLHQKDAHLLLNLCDFWGLNVSQGKVRAINRWGGLSNHLSIAYLLSNICSKNYWNRTTVVEIIVRGWVVSFFETQCIKSYSATF